MNDRNDRIAIAKGWILRPADYPYRPALWQKPDGSVAVSHPNFTGTQQGVDGMMRELNQTKAEDAKPYYNWSLQWSALFQIRDFYGEDEITGERRVQFQSTKKEGSGIAVGKAYVSVFGKEADDAV